MDDKSESSGDTVSSSSATSIHSPAARVETHSFSDWIIRCCTSHILPSKCSGNCDENERCIFCCFTTELAIPHLPEMVFPYNFLELRHKSGCSIAFNALDALRCVKADNFSLKIACSESWKQSREETGLVDKTIGDHDWTFQTDYNGSYSNWPNKETSETGIDMEVLKKRDRIDLYRDIMLYEDELHDNGVAVCSVRIRVMPSSFFILLRYFLRVDGVLVMANDARVYHDFTTDYVVVETSQREDKVKELQLQVPLSMMTEPDEITPRLTLRKFVCEKLSLPR